jgi:DNA sulfur modification protein DndD
MIFERIVLENFGVFRGRQSLDLDPVSVDKPIILIGGLNGGGKTTFLDALQVALYGRMARCSNRGSLGYDEYILRCVHRGIGVAEPMALELHFRRLVQGEEQRYALRRWWDLGGEQPLEHLTVSVNGTPDPVLTESWPEQVEAILPQGLSSLFFFDGEKIEELATPRSAASVLSTALSSLLGLEVVDRLGTDLAALNRRKLAELGSEADRSALQTAEVEVRTLEKLIEETERVRAGEQNELDRSLHEFADAEGRHRREGGALVDREQAIAAELQVARTEWDSARAEFWHHASGAAPLVLVQPQLQAILSQSAREHEHAEATLMCDLLVARDAKIVGEFRKSQRDAAVVKRLEALLADDRKRSWQPRSNFKSYLNLDEGCRAQVAHLLETVFPELRKNTKDLEMRIARAADAIANLERKLSAVPDKEIVGGTARLLKERGATLERARASLAVTDAKLRELRRDLEHKKANLIRFLERDVGEKLKEADDQRLLVHATRVRKTLTEFRASIVRRHVSRIEHLVLECFQQVLHKTSLVTEIRIDPESYALTLYGGDRQPLLPERLSAGERQLLAIALLWGLARAAGRALPTIVDTPLGRLDTAHRRHLVERYFPHASHQVVLLATDSEIDGEYHAMLQRSITRSYTLVHDPVQRCTSIQPGFFSN